MASLTSLWNAQTVTPQNTLIDYYKKQEELKCDPLYMAVTLGNIHLLSTKLIKEHEKAITDANKIGRQPPTLNGIKISFKENCSIQIEEPGILQTATRTVSGSSRSDLEFIRPHLIKLLRWFDYEDLRIKKILELCQLGIKDLLRGYQNQGSQKIILSQKSSLSSKAEVPIHEKKKNDSSVIQPQTEIKNIIKMQTHPREAEAIIRILENDIALLNQAIKDKDEREKKELKDLLEQEENKYFPLNQIKLLRFSQSIDKYMQEVIKKRWEEETLQGVVRLFSAPINQQSFNHFESIQSLVSKNPQSHAEMKKNIYDSLCTTTLSCDIIVENLDASSLDIA